MNKIVVNFVFFVSILFLALSCTDSTTKELPKSPLVNKTEIDDSIYYFFWLNTIDTMDGFDQYFSDSRVSLILKDDYASIKSLDTNYNSVVEKIMSRLMLKNYFLNTHKNRIRLRQKGSKWKYGCYDGTIRTVKFVLRDNKSFDVHSMTFLSDDLYEGTYINKSDTLYLTFTTEKPVYISETMLLSENSLRSIGELDTNYYYFSFYLGDCLGLN